MPTRRIIIDHQLEVTYTFLYLTTINYQSHQELMRFVYASDPQWCLTA